MIDTKLPAPAAGFFRVGMLQAAARGNVTDAALMASQFDDSTPGVQRILRAAVTSGSTHDADFASSLMDYRLFSGEYVDLERKLTIIGKVIRYMRRVPFNTRTLLAAGGTASGWVAEGAPFPAQAPSMAEIVLTHSKNGALVVVTQELTRFWTQASEGIIRADLVAAGSESQDRLFIDPSVAAAGLDSPASITYGITPRHSSGSTVDAITADLKALAQSLIDLGSNLSAAVWVMHPRTALSMSVLRDSSGALAFASLGLTGGSVLGLPVIVSGSVPITAGSPGGQTIVVLLDPKKVVIADDGLATIGATSEGTIQMTDTPGTGEQYALSLFQNHLAAILVKRYIRWARCDDSAVALLDGVTY